MKAKTQNNDLKINLNGLYYNISRVYEIAKVGGHSITFYYYSHNIDLDRSVNPKDIQLLLNYYGLPIETDGDIQCDFERPDFDQILSSFIRKHETKDEVDERIKSIIKNNPRPDFYLNDAGFSLLKAAYNRLNLCVNDIEIIKNLTVTIAQIANQDVRMEHLAEAIQYRSLRAGETVKVYGI